MPPPPSPTLTSRPVLAVLGAGAAGVLVVGGAVGLVRRTAAGHLFTLATVPPAPVALALGAQVYPNGTPSAFLTARLDLAKRLLDQGTVSMIVVSGDHAAAEYNEPLAMQTYLLQRGVPADRVICDDAGFDTYDSCYRARAIFGIQQMIIVTQSYHLPRAVATARMLGIDASGVGDDTVRAARRSWRKGWIRDQLACVKTMIDLAARRKPMLGPPDSGVRDALAS